MCAGLSASFQHDRDALAAIVKAAVEPIVDPIVTGEPASDSNYGQMV